MDRLRRLRPRVTCWGIAAAAVSFAPGQLLVTRGSSAAAEPVDPDALQWLVGDHHVHTQYSHDAKYRIKDQLDAAQYFGVDWIVFTEHSNFQHADPGVFTLRYGIDAPDEFRMWRDADPEIMIGMEGAPGAQGYAYGRIVWDGDQRGEYGNQPRADTFPAFGVETLRTWGGWDWMTATVGGFWDSMLAEGKPFYITTNSDSHLTSWHTWRLGDYPDSDEFSNAPNENEKMRLLGGRRPHPIDTHTGQVAGELIRTEGGHQVIAGDLIRSEVDAQFYRDGQAETQGGSDFWPGQFTRLHTGVTDRSYQGVMDATLGGRLQAERGSTVTVSMTITTTTTPVRYIQMSTADLDNVDPTVAVEEVPNLAFVDIIGGPITGPVADPETHRAPGTKVLTSFDTAGRTGTYTLTHTFDDVQDSFYVRFRGSDGKRHGAGYHGAEVDPRGPIMHDDAARAGNPWFDTWFYANPVFIDVVEPSPTTPTATHSATPPASQAPRPLPDTGN